MRLIALLIVFCFTLNSNSQPVVEFRKYKDLAPNAEVVSPNYYVDLNLSLQNDKIKVDYAVYEELLYLGSSTKDYSDRSVSSSDFCKLNKVDAYTLVPLENKYKRIDVVKYTRKTIGDGHIFDDDREELLFNLLHIDKGAKTVIKTSYQITDPHLLPSFSISPYIHHFNAIFTLTYHEDIDIEIDTLNMALVKMEHTTGKSGSKKMQQWKMVVSVPFKSERASPDDLYIAPQIIPRIRSYKVNEIKVSVLDSLANLHKWYSTFIAKSEEQSDVFRSISDSIVLNCRNTLEKASRIYDWVQKNIRYIAFETAYEGVIPEKATLVYKERYGDCKGMANLLTNLLRSQNIEAYLCWIGTDDLPYKYSEIPSPVVDNHMIAAVNINDTLLFLDPTHSNLPFGMPSPFIQAKEALVNLKSYNQYKLVNVPVIDGDQNMFYDSCGIALQGKNVTGKGVAILSGYTRMDFMEELDIKDYKETLDFCRRNLLKGSNNFRLDTVWFGNIDKKDKPLYIFYTFQIPDYAIESDGEHYINLNLDKISLPSAINDNRKLPMCYRYNKSEINIVTLNLNNGLNALNLPSNTYYKDEIFSFENKYSRSGSQLQRYQTYKRNRLQLNLQEIKSFNKLRDKILSNYQEQVILK